MGNEVGTVTAREIPGGRCKRALHLRRELGDDPGLLGFRCHRSHW